MPPRWLTLAAVGALALGGVMLLPGYLSDRADAPSAGEEAVGAASIETAGPPSPSAATGPAAPRGTDAGERQVPATGTARLPPRPAWRTTPSAEPPIDVGDPLDADDGGALPSSLSLKEPEDIGPFLDADDPRADASRDLPGAPVDIGEPLDADGPGARPARHAAPVQVGRDLDADEPAASPLDEEPAEPVDIGLPLDASVRQAAFP